MPSEAQTVCRVCAVGEDAHPTSEWKIGNAHGDLQVGAVASKRKRSEVMHECTCRICGNTFYASNKRQVICSDECKKIASREWKKRYVERHEGQIRERQRLRKEKRKLDAKRKPDTIVGKGYAERQIADSLKRAGRVRTEL